MVGKTSYQSFKDELFIETRHIMWTHNMSYLILDLYNPLQLQQDIFDLIYFDLREEYMKCI